MRVGRELRSAIPGGAMADLEVFAHMKVRPGRLEGFKEQAAEVVRLTREKDTQTLRYDWFISRDGTECETHETYPSSEGLLEHNANVAEARGKLFAEFADDHFMTVYGEVSQELGDLMERMQKAGHLRVTFFSFVEGLESLSSV
jgi:quinol monooxygenase YgiN